jgi:hypothetical protein
MIVLYSDTTPELELQASEQELYELSKALGGAPTVIKCETEGVTDDIYPKVLRSISVNALADQIVDIQVTEDESLQISGEPARLSILAENVKNFAGDRPKGEHIHIDYYDDHPYLASTSIPIVIMHL